MIYCLFKTYSRPLNHQYNNALLFNFDIPNNIFSIFLSYQQHFKFSNWHFAHLRLGDNPKLSNPSTETSQLPQTASPHFARSIHRRSLNECETSRTSKDPPGTIHPRSVEDTEPDSRSATIRTSNKSEWREPLQIFTAIVARVIYREIFVRFSNRIPVARKPVKCRCQFAPRSKCCIRAFGCWGNLGYSLL